MTTPLPLWGTVRLDTDERLDKPDALALQNANMEYVVRAIGAAFGWGGGCVTPPTATFQTATSPRTLKLGGFQYYVCEPILPESPSSAAPSFPVVYKGFRGNLLTVDPADAGQITDISFDAVWNIAQANYASPITSMYPFLYAQPQAVEVDADARILWDGGSGSGQPATIKTRTAILCAFKFSTKMPQEELGWAPILQILWPDLNPAVGPGQPAVRYIGWKDALTSQAFTGDADEGQPLNWPERSTSMSNVLAAKQQESTTPVPNSDLFPSATPFADVGLIQTLQILQSKVVKGMDVDQSRYWYQRQAGSNPSVSQDLLTVFDRLSSLWALPAVIAAGTVYYGGGTTYYYPAMPVGITGLPSRVSAGVVTIQVDPAVMSSYAAVSVVASLNAVSGGSAAEHIAAWFYALGGDTYIQVVMDNSGPQDADFSFTLVGRRV